MAMESVMAELRELLSRLAEETGALPFSALYTFSDMAGDKLHEFRSAWDEWPAAQRRRLVRTLVELAESSIHVNFDAVYRHGMDDPDEEVRTTSIAGLWENENPSLVGPLLVKLRSDPSHQVRAAAASALGRFVLAGELEDLEATVHARIVTELLTTFHLTHESIEARRRAAESIAYASTPEVVEVLETAYDDTDELMRLSAVVGMGRTCSDRWREILLEELESSSAAMRYEAVLACGGLALQAAVRPLTALLQDSDLQLRNAAIWSLGQIGGDRAKQALLEAFDDADDDTRMALEEALGELALGEGDLDLLLYEIDEEQLEADLDDEWDIMWSSTDEED